MTKQSKTVNTTAKTAKPIVEPAVKLEVVINRLIMFNGQLSDTVGRLSGLNGRLDGPAPPSEADSTYEGFSDTIMSRLDGLLVTYSDLLRDAGRELDKLESVG